MPKRGKGGTLANRLAHLHALVHIENVAIDLTFDIIARFTYAGLPREFYDDFTRIAEDEARHFTLLNTRLEALGSRYGALPAHAGLWESAMESKGDVLVRLALEHMVHEARGIDILPTTIQRFLDNGDSETAAILRDAILPDEVTHVAAGTRWFSWYCQNVLHAEPIPTFHTLVPRHFHGAIKPPFNAALRLQAGMGPEWYEPLVALTANRTVAAALKRAKDSSSEHHDDPNT